MSDKTGISWTDATWNCVTGCSHVSDGCRYCFAETLSLRHRWSRKPWTAPNAAENVILHPERLDRPLHWKRPRRVFVNSMSDLFHERVPFEFLLSVWWQMGITRHTYQILTKRPERMLEFAAWMERRVYTRPDGTHWVGVGDLRLPGEGDEHAAKLLWPLRNVWLGVSIEQDRWTGRADLLRQMPAARRFISAEPLLEPLPSLDLTDIHWLIFGGESAGPEERRMVTRCDHVTIGTPGAGQFTTMPHERTHCPLCRGTGWVPMAWAVREACRLRDLARANRTAFFLKQFGGPTPKSGGDLLDGRQYHEFPANLPFPIDERTEVGE